MSAEFAVLIASGFGCLLYLLACLFYLLGWRNAGARMFAAGWVVNFLVFIANWKLCGEPPFGNMYHVLVFLSLCFFPLFQLILRREDCPWTAPYFAFAAFLPLLGTCFMDREVVWRRMPALQSHWFVPHVFSYMVSYALMAVAFFITLGGWFREGFRKSPGGGASPVATAIIRLAFPFMTFGLLSGALWAEEAWGVYWSWDPKETWSLITWTLYVVYLHCRLRPELRRYALPVQILAFLALLVTFLVVNLLPKLGQTLHSYS